MKGRIGALQAAGIVVLALAIVGLPSGADNTAGAQSEPLGGTIEYVEVPISNDGEDFDFFHLDSAEDFLDQGGWAVVDAGGEYEQLIRYESAYDKTRLGRIFVDDDAHQPDEYYGLFVQPASDEPCLPSSDQCSPWLVDSEENGPPDPESALQELQQYDEPDLRKPEEVDLSTVSVKSHDLFVSDSLNYYLLQTAIGTNTLGSARGVFTTYEVDPDVDVWRPIQGFDGAPEDDFFYADFTFPEPVSGCRYVVPDFSPSPYVCIPENLLVSSEWISFTGVPTEDIDRLEYLSTDGAWLLLLRDPGTTGTVPVPSDASDHLTLRLGHH